jgi:hypothetical protein
VYLCFGEQGKVLLSGEEDLEHVIGAVGERHKDVERIFVHHELIGPAFGCFWNDIDIEPVIIEREAVVLHLQKEVLPDVLLFGLVVVVENERQKEFDDQEEECEALEKGLFFR